jgi:hypothetical protein
MLDEKMLKEEMLENGITEMSVASYAKFREMTKGVLILTIESLIDCAEHDNKCNHREGYELGRSVGHKEGYEEARSLN